MEVACSMKGRTPRKEFKKTLQQTPLQFTTYPPSFFLWWPHSREPSLWVLEDAWLKHFKLMISSWKRKNLMELLSTQETRDNSYAWSKNWRKSILRQENSSQCTLAGQILRLWENPCQIFTTRWRTSSSPQKKGLTLFSTCLWLHSSPSKTESFTLIVKLPLNICQSLWLGTSKKRLIFWWSVWKSFQNYNDHSFRILVFVEFYYFLRILHDNVFKRRLHGIYLSLPFLLFPELGI